MTLQDLLIGSERLNVDHLPQFEAFIEEAYTQADVYNSDVALATLNLFPFSITMWQILSTKPNLFIN